MSGSDRLLQNIFLANSFHLRSIKRPLKDIKAIEAISRCRTENLGTSYYRCEENHEIVAQHHSCQHRSCFLCAKKNRIKWIESQRTKLFNTGHFHVVFTLPHEYLDLWRYNQSLFIRIIFKASQETITTLMNDSKYHGVTPGILMVLHTWGRQLPLHPHTHCLVTGGGLTKNGEWQDSGDYLLPIRVVKALYRDIAQALIIKAFESKELILPPAMDEMGFRSLYRKVYKKPWSVRIQDRYEHGQGVMLYLSRYIKGGPLDPSQIEHCSSKAIVFRYLDHRDKRKKKLSLTPAEFTKRLLLHVPPEGMHMVRYYGLYASSRKKKRERCKEMLGDLSSIKKAAGSDWEDVLLFCKQCGGPLRYTHSVWNRFRKGNSLNEASATGFAQHLDEAEIANTLRMKDCRKIQV